MLVPLGGKDEQTLVLLERQGGRINRSDIAPVRFVPLLGAHGWSS
jgi:protein-L-isoaspartate(D-aspartate) O-methyltransferase